MKTEQSMKVKYSTGGCFLQNYILKAIKNATLSLDLILMQHNGIVNQTNIYTLNFNHFQNILGQEFGHSPLQMPPNKCK